MSAEKRPTLFGFPIVEVDGMETPDIRLSSVRLVDAEGNATAPPPIRDHCQKCDGLGWIVGEWQHPLGFTARVRRCDCR